MEYKQKLGNVDATLNTTDKVMKIADPHKVLNTFLTLLIVIALILILIAALKKVIGNSAESIWDFLAKPFINLSERWKAADNIQKEETRTGQRLSLSLNEAKDIADKIDDCITSLGIGLFVDEHQVRDILIYRVKNAPNYRQVEGQFGTRTHKGLLGKTLTIKLSDLTNSNKVMSFTNPNLIRDSLIAIGVTDV